MRFYDLSEMKRRLAELDAERAPLVRLITAAEAYEESSQGRGSTPESLPTGKPSAPSGKTVQQITEDTALESIAATGKPIQTREVIEIMRQRSLPLPNKNLTNVVSARLSNSGRLEGRRGIGWWPKGRPWPDEQPSFSTTPGDVEISARGEENGEANASPETGERSGSPVDFQGGLPRSG